MNNSAIDDGGGLYNYSSSPIVNKVTFNGNSASDDGGAIYNYSSSPSITDVKFNTNYAGSGAGGAIHNYYNSSPNIVDASFLKNGAYEGSSGTAPAIFSLTDESVVIYVDKDAKGKSNGTSWTNAYTDLQRAIAAAPFGSQIWVAEGTYKPTLKVGTDARQYSFKLKNGVAIYGGFAGSETKLGQRDIDSNPTILSGDINKTGHADDNSYHVVVADYTTSSTILDGFTISDGNANSYSNSNDDGGGIYAVQSQAIFANLIIQNNKASDNGGGVFTSDGLNQFVNVSFIYNTANYNGGGLYSNSSSILTNTIFDNNAANYGGAVYNAGSLIANGTALANNIAKNSGGGIYSNYKSSFNLTNTVFDSNRATSYGGAIYNYNTGSSSTIVNSIFDRNTSKIGGAIYNTSSSAVGTNLTFANNQAESGAAVYSNGNSNNKPTYYNSIFWGNKGTSNTSPIANNGANTIVRNSIVQGGYDGLEVTNEDPKFANLGLGDFRLQKDSPAVDAGINEFVVAQTDLIGNARVVDGKVDIGAYEYFAKQDLSNVSGTIGDSDIPVININPEDRFEMADIHRFYQPQKGLHLYTSDVNEINHIKKQSAVGVLNYNYEEEKYTVLNSDRDALTGKGIEGVKPVYRFFNNDTGAHLYTMDENEKNYILDRLPNYGFENIKYYAFESQPENLETFPVYRMRNSDTGAHLFTVDQNEVNYIQNNLSNYSLEGNGGVAFYVFALD